MKIRSYKEFQDSLGNNSPDEDWSEALKALWFDAKGDWESSHTIAQEGDEFNASYWYRRAEKPFPKISVDAEHQEIVELILK